MLMLCLLPRDPVECKYLPSYPVVEHVVAILGVFCNMHDIQPNPSACYGTFAGWTFEVMNALSIFFFNFCKRPLHLQAFLLMWSFQFVVHDGEKILATVLPLPTKDKEPWAFLQNAQHWLDHVWRLLLWDLLNAQLCSRIETLRPLFVGEKKIK